MALLKVNHLTGLGPRKRGMTPGPAMMLQRSHATRRAS